MVVSSPWFLLVVADDRPLDLLQSLHIVYAGNLADAVNDVLQVLQVGDIEDDIDVRLAIAGAGFDVADVGFSIANHGRDLLQHAEAIVAEDGEFYRVGAGVPSSRAHSTSIFRSGSYI